MEKIYFSAPAGVERPFRLLTAGITFPDPSYKIVRARSDIFVVEYVAEGGGTVSVDDVTFKVKAGDTYILPAGSRHEYFSDRERPFKKLWMNVSGPLCGGIIRSCGLSGRYLFESEATGALMEKFLHCCAEAGDMAGINETAAEFFLRIMLKLCISAETIPANPATKAREFIENNIYKPISATDAADTAGLSVSQLGRLFKAEYGRTVYADILEFKIETAKNLLRNTALSAKEISDMLCFCDEHYFSNLFKRKTGSTPVGYRKSAEE